MTYEKEKNNPLRTKHCSGRAKRNFIAKSWWVILFLSVCNIVYIQACHKKNEVIAQLDEQLNALGKEHGSLLQENEDLLLQVNSQSDPAWIQLTLMKGLGLVPEGQLKVYFYKEDAE